MPDSPASVGNGHFAFSPLEIERGAVATSGARAKARSVGMADIGGGKADILLPSPASPWTCERVASAMRC
jgi:hypothetical protein